MAYGWQAWKNRGGGQAGRDKSRSRLAKDRAYVRGFKEAARELGIDAEGATCPHSVLDDPGIDAGGAHDMGRFDAKQASRARVA